MTARVRLLDSTWDPGFIAAIRRHYTGSAGPPPGKKLAWALVEDERIVGYAGMGEPSFKLAPRRRLGLADARPLPGTVSWFILRLEAPSTTRCSEWVRLLDAAADRDWLARYGWVPVHRETMIGLEGRDPHEGPPGACFRSAGYRSLGMTTGRSARRPPGFTHGARVWSDAEPKLVLYRGPLARIDPAAG